MRQPLPSLTGGVGGGSALWLSLELILVTFVLWWTLDPVLVTSYVTHLPLGYDPDRLVKLEVASSVTRQEQHKDLYKSIQEAEVLLQKALQVAEDCGCAYGCPSCVGPVGEVGEDGKRTAMRLLRELTK
jgi:hypothetical protein